MQENKKLDDLTVNELKVLAYDQSVLLNQTQNNLRIIESLIVDKINKASNNSPEKDKQSS